MATITVRALNPITWEPQFGNGQKNFLSDKDAVAQIIATRLRLFKGEWFLNTEDGLPMFNSQQGGSYILGSPAGATNIQALISAITNRILGSPYVLSMASVNTSYFARKLNYSAGAVTKFGNIVVSNTPASSTTIVENG
jgi:hypothetical protein